MGLLGHRVNICGILSLLLKYHSLFLHMLSKTSLQIAFFLVLGEMLGLVIVLYCELLSCLLNLL